METANPLERSSKTDHAEELTVEHLYDPKAIRLVVKGYEAINNALIEEKKRGVFAKGAILIEVVHSKAWTMPDLLDEIQLETFRRLTHQMTLENTLEVIWLILENVCDERQLMPCVVLDRKTSHLSIRLLD